MKYLVVLVSGAPPFLSRPDLTKDLPALGRLVEEGYSGKIHVKTTIPTQDEYISILPVLGYAPDRYYNGEGSLLAARAGVHLEKDDIAFCCDLVTLKHPQDGYFFPKFGPKITLESIPAESADDELGKELIREINQQLGTESIVFYPVKDYSHLMVWVGGKSKIQTVSPGEIFGKSITAYLPKGDGSATLTRCMEVASQFLQQHPLNEERIAQEKPAINGIWFSRPGRTMELATWEELYDLRGGLIAADGMIQGIGQLAGLNPIEVQDSEEISLKERCQSKTKGILKSLSVEDFIFVHLPVEENDRETSPQTFDRFFMSSIMEHLDKNGEWKFLFLESSPLAAFPRKFPYLPIDKEISFLIASPGLTKKTGLVLKEGDQLMSRFIKGGVWE